MKKHINIALFVPHSGCPHTCAFCNQHLISGQINPLNPESVQIAAKTALAHGAKGGEIAFFGGSFTAIEPEYMISLLEAAYPFIKNGDFSGIRISTRPDAIDEEKLELLKSYGVKVIELGAQSMSNSVLDLNERGHTAEDTKNASRLIRAQGFQLVLQMMTGLYGDSEEGAIQTAYAFLKLKPSAVRIYPTVVLEGTTLARLYQEGIYTPQTLEDAVSLGAHLLKIFHKNQIPVIRMGLHANSDVETHRLAGAYHPAFRELCEAKLYRELVLEELSGRKKGEYLLTVANREISKLIGQRKENILFLQSLGFDCRVKGSDSLLPYEIEIQFIGS